MTAVPLPDVSCVKVYVKMEDAVGNAANTRFFLKYTSGAPSGPNCTALATAIAGVWSTDLAALVSSNSALKEIDIIDIAGSMGASGQWTGSDGGTRSGSSLPASIAFNVEYGIGERYRGGKPRGFWPFGVEGDLTDPSHWTGSLVTAVDSGVAAFFAAVEALTDGSFAGLKHVDLSYYSGFTNHTNTSGRSRAVPTYRATAQHRDVTGYFAKQLVSQQRRRRLAVGP